MVGSAADDPRVRIFIGSNVSVDALIRTAAHGGCRRPRQPAAFVANSARRFSGFWLAEWWAGYRHIDWYYSLGHVALTGLACAGAWRARRRGVGFAVVALVLFAMPYALTVHGHGRYRVPIEPVLCLLGALTWRPAGRPRGTLPRS